MCSFFIITNLYNGILYILVLITREIEPVIIVGGHLVNEVINKIVKFLVKSQDLNSMLILDQIVNMV